MNTLERVINPLPSGGSSEKSPPLASITSMISWSSRPAPSDVKRTATNVAQIHITGTHGDFAGQKTIGRAVVAAPSRLVKHQARAVFGFEECDEFKGSRCGNDFVNPAFLQKTAHPLLKDCPDSQKILATSSTYQRRIFLRARGLMLIKMAVTTQPSVSDK